MVEHERRKERIPVHKMRKNVVLPIRFRVLCNATTENLVAISPLKCYVGKFGVGSDGTDYSRRRFPG